ncbi:hypothetical protein XENOCAPTIV_017730, partial [Xenoophorus captivus]
ALRVSMEEQRQRQEDEARRAAVASVAEANISSPVADEFVAEEMDTGADMDSREAKDPEFLQSVLENLPGVDPNNEAIRNAMGSLASQTGSKSDSKKDEEKKK